MTVTPLTSPSPEDERTNSPSEPACYDKPGPPNDVPIYAEPEPIFEYDSRGRPKLQLLTKFRGF